MKIQEKENNLKINKEKGGNLGNRKLKNKHALKMKNIEKIT
jgi:hypothetical protein